MNTASARPQVIDTGSQLREFWDRSVFFFGNLKALFFGNEEQTRQLAKEVGGVESYGGRLIPVLNLIFRRANNILLLEREADRTLCSYFRNRHEEDEGGCF